METAPIESADVLMEAAEGEDATGPRPTEAEISYLRDPVGNPERLVMGRLRREELQLEMRKALRKLRDRDRRVMRMRYWDELTRREIGELEGITQKAVRVAEDRAEEVLRADKKTSRSSKNILELGAKGGPLCVLT